jgi:NAD(P)-dependent dehydrogenase (short-subunit alcohol dehydrogenase family)
MDATSDDERVALVTGANKGIGKEIARGLVRRGMTVLLGARDLDRGKAAAEDLSGEGKVVAVQLDVTDNASIERLAAAVERDYGRLDVLVNNAGTNVGYQKPSVVTVDDFRTIYETNVFGVVAVTNALLPLLRRSDAGRIVNVTSLRGSVGAEGAWVGQPSMPYSSSKTALNAITVHYARELADTVIKVNGAAPGHVATDFNGFRGTRTPAEGAAIAIRLATLDASGPSGGVFDDKGKLPW